MPKRTEVPVMGLVSTKNFVKTNALENILSKPPPEKAALAAAGERETSKTCDDFRHSEHARVPEYLKDVKEEIQVQRLCSILVVAPAYYLLNVDVYVCVSVCGVCVWGGGVYVRVCVWGGYMYVCV